jgi:hypothetical protein
MFGGGYLLGREHTCVMLHLKLYAVVVPVLLQLVLAAHASHSF